jgi:hypothetical protein
MRIATRNACGLQRRTMLDACCAGIRIVVTGPNLSRPSLQKLEAPDRLAGTLASGLPFKRTTLAAVVLCTRTSQKRSGGLNAPEGSPNERLAVSPFVEARMG